MRYAFECNDVWHSRGRGFSMGYATRDGYLLHFTGQVAWNAQEEIIGLGDVREQTRQCFRNIHNILAHVGGEMSDIVSITTYFMERAHLPVIQNVRGEWLAAANPPASTSVMVAGLGHEDFLVELTPVAVIPTDRFRAPACGDG